VRIHYRAWGETGRPEVVLVHGAAAHSGWWAHIAPLLTGRRVIAPDLSGHGDSGHRPSYDMDRWADEIVAVATDAGLRRPVVVGHSMGGRAAVTAAVRHPAAVAAVVCVDTPATRRAHGGASRPERSPEPRAYRTIEDAVAGFRTRPATAPPDYLREFLARESLRSVDGGWTWKADQGVFGRGRQLQDLLPLLPHPLALLRGAHGLVPADMAADMIGVIGRPVPVVELPEAGHHPMLDAPLTLVTALRTLLATWPARA
jgi:pimeloyl-ACP methyl ester carboxylesterase